MTPLRLGTRGSELALWQANTVAAEIGRRSGRGCETVVITTTGDRLTDVSLSTVGGKRVFVKEIEQALARGHIDLAVHSAKDLPADLPDGLAISAVLPREDPRDAVVLAAGAMSTPNLSVRELVAAQGGAPRVGSGSVRRVAQLRRLMPTARFPSRTRQRRHPPPQAGRGPVRPADPRRGRSQTAGVRRPHFGGHRGDCLRARARSGHHRDRDAHG